MDSQDGTKEQQSIDVDDISSEIESTLLEWRTKALNVLLTVIAIVALLPMGAAIVSAVSNPDQWALVLIFPVLYLFFLGLIIFRRLNVRLRGWGVLALGYLVSVVAFARGGLAGAGPVYMLALPILAIILVSVRSGLIMAALNVITYVAFAFLAEAGILNQWLIYSKNPLTWDSWALEGFSAGMLLVLVLVLLVYFHRFQVKTMEAERHASQELAQTSDLLEQYSRTLEEKVEKRTQQLRSTNQSLSKAIRAKDTLLGEFRAVLDTIEYGVLLLNPELRTRAANRVFKEMWGFSNDFIARKPTMAELINYNRETGLHEVPESEWDAYVEQRVAAVRRGKVPPTEFRLGDGRILRYQAMVLPGGGRMLTYFDVTDLVRQSEYMSILHETTLGLISRLNLSDLLEALVTRAGQMLNTPHGFIYLSNPEGTELECKVGVGDFSKTIGACLKPGEGLSGRIWQTGQPLVVADYDTWPGRSARFDDNLIGAVMGAPLKSKSQTVGVIGIAYGVDSARRFGRKEVELLSRFAQLASIALDNAWLYQEAQRERRYFESLVLNSPVAVVVIDLDGRVTSWNPAAETLFGYAEDEAVGHNVDDLVASDEVRDEAISFTQRGSSGDRIHAITRRCRKDGSMVDVELLAVPVILEKELVGTFVIYHDITELQRARQEAEAANQAKSAFLATMSHEIRTPMNAVIGMTSLLLDTNLTPEQHEFVETIRTSGDALLTIINDILDFSKIEAGKMDLEHQPFDLRECVESALDLMANEALEKGLDIGCLFDEQVPLAIYGDVTRLRQILVNLLSNAVKFTKRGEVIVSVESSPLDTPLPIDRRRAKGDSEGDSAGEEIGQLYELHFSVRDTGIGIPPDRMDRLFRSFSQIDTSTTRRYGGTGLGLAISRRLSELMGGTIWAESEVGQGSAFHFTIRAQVASAPEPAYLRAKQPDLRGKRLMIVDDNATNRRILTLQTQAWGMLSQATASPSEALAWIRQGTPLDIAILDMQMPEMDGMTLAREIRRERDAEALPLVMLTSLGIRGSGENGEEFAAFLTKPIKASQLYDALIGVFAEDVRPETKDEKEPKFDSDMGKRLPLRILMAEDNVVNQKLTLRLLERLGYRADVAANGLEVLEALRRQMYDVVLMDIQMPEMDGLEATRRIRRETDIDRQPCIIAMTANAMKEDREECLAAGMDDYLSKPIRVAELMAALSGALPQDNAS